MVDKTISFDELLALAKDGARIETERRPMVIEQLGELIARLDAIAKSNEERAAADLARSKTQLEVLATLQAMIRNQAGVKISPPVDLAPLKTVLTEIRQATERAESKAPAIYEFDIERNGQGYMSKITAIPQAPRTH